MDDIPVLDSKDSVDDEHSDNGNIGENLKRKPDNESSDYTVINTMSSSTRSEIGINKVKTVTP